jgi:uncharacterized membrane protein
MTRLITFVLSLLPLGVTHAMEVHDAPIPESNYVGILIFLVLMIGSSVWFFWHIMHKDKRDKLDKQNHIK